MTRIRAFVLLTASAAVLPVAFPLQAQRSASQQSDAPQFTPDHRMLRPQLAGAPRLQEVQGERDQRHDPCGDADDARRVRTHQAAA